MNIFKDIKHRGLQHLKRNYLLLVMLLIVASFIGSTRQSSLSLLSANTASLSAAGQVIRLISEGNIDDAKTLAVGNEDTISQVSKQLGIIQFGHQKGVLSDFVNSFASGSFWASLASSILALTGSASISGIIVTIFALLFIGFETIFLAQIFKVIYARVILESRTYKKYHLSTFTYLFRTGTWIKASLAFFRYNLYMFLWELTIIGGIIKSQSYGMVKYILAENPTISGKDAINLSRRMMNGHKWEFFLFRLSFIGWRILSFFTFGIIDVFFANPYYAAAEAEYFVYVRKLAKENKIEGIELLNDIYLYKKAPMHEIKEAYKETIEIMNKPLVELKQPSKLRAFFQDNFGFVLSYDAEEEAYRKDMAAKAKINSYKDAVNELSYPIKLCPIKVHEARPHLEHMHFIRHYSLSSLIMIFFSFCLVGWLWEVSIHIVKDGRFVNRGVMHGPWLPIYGTGAVLVLLFLYRLRKHILAEFGATILLAGVVEYFSSYMLSVLHNGQKWWDYTGYFLNINGRVCAEGLLVFGIAGTAAVYFLAPMLDNFFSRIKISLLRSICVVLIVLFMADLVYSQFVPNTGKGITDYDIPVSDTAVSDN